MSSWLLAVSNAGFQAGKIMVLVGICLEVLFGAVVVLGKRYGQAPTSGQAAGRYFGMLTMLCLIPIWILVGLARMVI